MSRVLVMSLLLVCVASRLVLAKKTTGQILAAALGGLSRKDRTAAITLAQEQVNNNPERFYNCLVFGEDKNSQKDCSPLTFILKSVIIDMSENGFECTDCTPGLQKIVNSVMDPIYNDNIFCKDLLSGLNISSHFCDITRT